MKRLIKLWLPFMALVLVVAWQAGCTYLPEGGTNTIYVTNNALVTNTTEQTNTSYVTNNVTNAHTNVTGITNFATITLTNTLEATVNSNDLSQIVGEWLVTMETYSELLETTNLSGQLIYVMTVRTNTYNTLSNAFTFKFNADLKVDKFSYNSNGVASITNSGYYLYSLLSNENGKYIELTDPDSIAETVYYSYEGQQSMTNETLTNYVYKTNYTKNYTVTNETITTNTSTFVMTITNNLITNSQKSKNIKTFIYSADAGFTNLTWSPNTIYTRSFAQVNMTLNTGTNGSSLKNSLIDFTLDPTTTYMLRKLP